jgi:hypothetical protein
MQLTMKDCGLLAFIFFSAPAVGTMVAGAPVPIDARNEINRLQDAPQNELPTPVIEQRAPEPSSSKSSSSGGLLGVIGQLAPFAEDLLPMIGLRDLETHEPKVTANAAASHAAAAKHSSAVAELSSKLINDPTAREKLYHVMTNVAASKAKPTHVQRAPEPSSSKSSSSGGILGIIGQLAPFAEDLLPLLALRDLDARETKVAATGNSNAAAAAAKHSSAVAELSSKLINDPTAQAKLYHVMTSVAATKAKPTHVQRAPAPSSSGSSSSSGGGGILGVIGQLAPFAEDLLDFL